MPVKTTEQQDIKALRYTLQLTVEQRTVPANQLRSLFAENGLILPVGLRRLWQPLPELMEDASENSTCTLRRSLS